MLKKENSTIFDTLDKIKLFSTSNTNSNFDKLSQKTKEFKILTKCISQDKNQKELFKQEYKKFKRLKKNSKFNFNLKEKTEVPDLQTTPNNDQNSRKSQKTDQKNIKEKKIREKLKNNKKIEIFDKNAKEKSNFIDIEEFNANSQIKNKSDNHTKNNIAWLPKNENSFIENSTFFKKADSSDKFLSNKFCMTLKSFTPIYDDVIKFESNNNKDSVNSLEEIAKKFDNF